MSKSKTGMEWYKQAFHLTSDQLDVLNNVLKAHSERPTFEEYEKWQKQMKLVDPPKNTKPKPKTIGHSSRGYERDEIRLQDDFNATIDLPPSWGIYPMFDSGANYKISSAGQLVLTDLWNGWYYQNNNTLKFIAWLTEMKSSPSC